MNLYKLLHIVLSFLLLQVPVVHVQASTIAHHVQLRQPAAQFVHRVQLMFHKVGDQVLGQVVVLLGPCRCMQFDQVLWRRGGRRERQKQGVYLLMFGGGQGMM